MESQGLNPDQLHVRQVLYLLYYFYGPLSNITDLKIRKKKSLPRDTFKLET